MNFFDDQSRINERNDKEYNFTSQYLNQHVALFKNFDPSSAMLTQIPQLTHPTLNLAPASNMITFPIAIPTTKSSEHQTVQIQMVNPNCYTSGFQPKLQINPVNLTNGTLNTAGTTVVTVAYNSQDNEVMSNHQLNEGMTILAAIQPHDLQPSTSQVPVNIDADIESHYERMKMNSDLLTCETEEFLNLKKEPPPISNSKRENKKSLISNNDNNTTTDTSTSKKRSKKSDDTKKVKPGHVKIATAIDGTILFCCPECHMAYPDKKHLEQHLLTHRIERRFICDICGAGLKRKEHLERHKLGHNPERPHICSVCFKGFKRKEHLNLHIVIHSGQKTEICGECGKGFYRKDHLRKHIRSHRNKRLKSTVVSKDQLKPDTKKPKNVKNFGFTMPQEVTIHVPTTNNVMVPIQIQLPDMQSTKLNAPKIKLETDS